MRTLNFSNIAADLNFTGERELITCRPCARLGDEPDGAQPATRIDCPQF
jgi:hypothetical protein